MFSLMITMAMRKMVKVTIPLQQKYKQLKQQQQMMIVIIGIASAIQQCTDYMARRVSRVYGYTSGGSRNVRSLYIANTTAADAARIYQDIRSGGNYLIHMAGIRYDQGPLY